MFAQPIRKTSRNRDGPSEFSPTQIPIDSFSGPTYPSLIMEGSSLIFIGTYTHGASRGIYSARLSGATGAVTGLTVAAETGAPTYLALSPDRRFLYAVRDTEAMAGAFAIDAGKGRL